MKPKRPLFNLPGLLAGVLLACTLRLPAQSPPVVTTPPTGQTNLAGTTASFSVGASGTSPFTYQWQFNGTNLPNGLITTVAGENGYGYSGDGGAAANAQLYYPYGAAFDANGNLYIADMDNGRIREVTTSGIITTVAGNGNETFAGDGGAATSAGLHYPAGVALDAAGNLYIADQSNNRIRQVATNGIITTVAGNGGSSYSGDRGPATNATLSGPTSVAVDTLGNLYIADKSNDRVRQVAANGIITTVAGNGGAGYAGDGGAATSAELYYPNGVAVDGAGNLYIADTYNFRIRKVNPNGIITTVAGNGGFGYAGDGGAATNASLNWPNGVALDAFGNLYIADSGDSRIRMVNTNGIINTVVGKNASGYAGDGGAATNAELDYPTGVVLDAAGNLYIADRNNDRIRKVWLYASNPTLTLAQVGAANAGNYSVVIANACGSVTSVVATLTVDLPPTITTQPARQFAVAGSSPSFSVAVTGTPPFNYSWYFNRTNLLQSGTNDTLTLPGISVNNFGNYTVVITNNYGAMTSQPAALTPAFPPTVAVQPAGRTNLAGTSASFAVTPGGTGPFFYQWQFNGANLSNDIITTVAGNGGANDSGNGVMATNGSLGYPTSAAFDAAGNMYIADCQDNHIRKVNTNGIITTVAGTSGAGYSGDGRAATNASLNWPNGVALDAFGNLYFADSNNNRIRKVDTNGIITTVVSNLHYPTCLTFDVSDNMYIADCNSSLILVVGTNGVKTTLAAGPLEEPFGVALDSSGNLYVADTDDNRVQEVSINGLVTTVAGTGTDGYSGDGGAATNASLSAPKGVAFDSFGNLYVADWGNNRIREVATNGIITTVAGTGKNGNLGDGGAAANADLGDPPAIAFDLAGNLYIADWQNQRIREVDCAGLPTLVLSNATVTNAGNYSVVITSPYGSVTSAVVSLTVTIPTTPPQIIASGPGFGFLTNQFGFNLNGAYGQTIVVDGSTNLLDWTPLFTNTANGSPFYFYDPAWTNFPWRFYRARLP